MTDFILLGCGFGRSINAGPILGTLFFLTMMGTTGAAVAENSERLHFALTTSNDSLGDWHDRWRSSSVEVGVLVGANESGQLPSRIGELREYRFRSDVLMPADVTAPNPNDRRHAGVLAFGLHSYAEVGEMDVRVGVDLVVVGQQTGLYDFQTRLHKILGFDRPNLSNFQIGDTEQLAVSAEAGTSLSAENWIMRPFAEIRVGPEDWIRTGVDLTFGAGPEDLKMRVDSTGHRVPYGVIREPGFHFVAGADVAWVDDSLYLPEKLGYSLTQSRIRVRGGAYYTGRRLDAFYGLAWLGKEFERQPEGQFVGTLQVKFKF